MYRRAISKWAVLCVMWAAPLQAWWTMGHRLVGYIGEQNLDPKTRTLLEPLLHESIEPYNEGLTQSLSSFPDASIWFDYVKNNKIPGLRKTHYINIPLSFEEMNQTLTREEVMNRLNQATKENPYNVIDCINWSMYQLAGYFSDEQVTPERAAALRYLLHLIGDLHQPLHVISLILPDGQGDEGGNKIRLSQSIDVEDLDHDVQRIDKLHKVFDSAFGSIVQDSEHGATKPRRDREKILDQAYQDLKKKFGNQSDEFHSISEWAVSTFLIAQTQIYQQIQIKEDFQDEKGSFFADFRTSPAQYKKSVTPVIQKLIWQGGIHLAEILNALRVQKYQYPFVKKNWGPML